MPSLFSRGLKIQKADHPKAVCINSSRKRMTTYWADPGMSMQSKYVTVLPVPRAVVPGVKVAVVTTLSKPTKVVLAVACAGTGQGSPEAWIGPCVVVTVPEALIQTANKQAWFAAKAVLVLKVKLSVADLDLNTPLLVKVKVLVVLKVPVLVPAAKPAAVNDR